MHAYEPMSFEKFRTLDLAGMAAELQRETDYVRSTIVPKASKYAKPAKASTNAYAYTVTTAGQQ